MTIPRLLLDRVAEMPERAAFMHRQGADWQTLTWKDLGRRVRDVACGLRAAGLGMEERCAILSGTRIEWVLADLGALCAGAATTTLYPSSTADECAYILRDSGSRCVFAEDGEQVARLVAKRDQLPEVRRVYVMDGSGSDDGWVVPLTSLLEEGRQVDEADPEAFERLARSVRPEAMAGLIYTSGTTGVPKGVELTHGNWTYTANALDALGIIGRDDLQLLWLPLAHAFGKVLLVAQLRLAFCTAIDGRIDCIGENLASVRPTFMAGVPRIFEKVRNKVTATATEAGGLKASIFQWAMKVGDACSALEQRGEKASALLAVQRKIADRLVFSRLRARFGGRIRFFISGSAPLSRQVATFFHSAGLLILEGYGLTESSAATFANLPTAFKFGTVGRPLEGTEVRIAGDGEVLLRNPGLMRGYWGRPEESAEMLADGWLHTGDVGELDPDGFLRITDRKKDLIKTSGGKYVAPQMLEGLLKAACPYLAHVIVHGDSRPYCVALLAIDPEAAVKWTEGNGGKAAPHDSPAFHGLVQACVDRVNSTLSSYQTIKKFAILPGDLSIEAGELTTSMKVRRRAVEARYRAMLDGMYG